MIIRKISGLGMPKARKLVLNKTKKRGFVNRELPLPAKKDVKAQSAEQVKGTKRLSSSECSDYEPYDYCQPLFP